MNKFLTIASVVTAVAMFAPTNAHAIFGWDWDDGGGATADTMNNAHGTVMPNQLPKYTTSEWAPFEAVNRGLFAVNNAVNYVVIHPVGYVWNSVIPTPARKCVNNFGANFNTPFSAVQNLLQAKPCDAGTEMKRFAINTTAGFLGLFDVADIPAKHQSFPTTMGVWGLGPVAHMEFPVIAQTTNVRDFGGSLGEGLVKGAATFGVSTVVNILLYVNNAEMLVDNRNWTMQADLNDPYSVVRDTYESNRETKIQEAMYAR